MNRSQAVRSLVERATTKYQMYISGPKAAMNTGGGVEYFVRSDLTDRQKEMFCIIASKWSNVESAFITRTYKVFGNERGRNLKVRFSTRADGSKA